MLQQLPAIAGRDHPNKVGILVTQAPEQPHTTVLAFLSSSDDDIFLITFPETSSRSSSSATRAATS